MALPLQTNADTRIETSTLSLTFNDQGSLIKADVCYPACRDPAARRLTLEEARGIIGFEQAANVTWVQRRGLPGARDANIQQLHFSGPKGQNISWIIPPDGFRIEAVVVNTGALVMHAGAGFEPRPAAGFGDWLERVRYVAAGRHGFRQIGLDETLQGGVLTDWAGFRNRFWTLLASGREESDVVFGAGGDDSGENNGGENNGGGHDVRIGLRRMSGLDKEQYLFYLGPLVPEELSAVDEILDELFYAGLWFWLRWICFGLYVLLSWIHSVVPMWGLAIMLLSLAVNVLMLPLSRAADRLQQQVNATETRLAPELSRIKKEFRGEAQAAKIVALYKAEGVHPLYSMKSLLGVAIVIPVFIGAFDMLAENFHLLHTRFLWIDDLSRPDALAQLPFSLPFFGAELNLLPFLMTVLSIIATWLHRPMAGSAESHRRQTRNMSFMAMAFFVLFYTFPAGMLLYWTSNNLISAGKGVWGRCRKTADTSR